jgi:hypothetical protein
LANVQKKQSERWGFCVLKLPALPRLVPGQRDKLNPAEIIIKQIFEIFGWDYLIIFGIIFMSLRGTKQSRTLHTRHE